MYDFLCFSQDQTAFASRNFGIWLAGNSTNR